MSGYLPTIGQWFQDRGNQQLFEVVAAERDEGTVQIQYLDGEIADISVESWAELSLCRAAAPEDWRSAFELDNNDAIDPDATLQPTQWDDPLNRIEPDTTLGIEDI